MINFDMIKQMLAQRGPGILGQEIGAQSFGGPGFLGQVDAQPTVAADQGFSMTPEMMQMMGQAGMQMMGQQQQQPPPQMPPQAMALPQGRPTVGMPQMNDVAGDWLRSRRNMPQIGMLGRSM